MKNASGTSPPSEIELKLVLPGADRRRIAHQLAVTPPLAGVAFQVLRLRNIYFDTPVQDLRQQKIALRLRSVREGTSSRPRWIQTLKTSGHSTAGLSQRGEWETPLRRGELDPITLQDTPWSAIDSNSELFAHLKPCFETRSTRTLWQVKAQDGSQIEVALDVGSVHANSRRMPICELELELIHGSPDALFAVAEELATHLAILPAQTSKAEQGWRLVAGVSAAPLRAHTLALEAEQAAGPAVQQVLAEMFGHFTENLVGILNADHAELVHQARVGWRRWRSGLWLFKPLLKDHQAPDTEELRPLLDALGAVRDLDVAALESLPTWAEAFVAGDRTRNTAWLHMEATLQAERRARRLSLLDALAAPATGLALMRLSRWLHGFKQVPETTLTLGEWAKNRTHDLHALLSDEVDLMLGVEDSKSDTALEHQHRVRLLAKRTRYCLEAMRPVLPKARTRRWTDQATRLQSDIGAARDLLLLADLLAPLGVDRGIVGFLRGVSAAQIASR
ncbi:CYTH and CHAD domain-containing protein [Ottowia thiooxydans]|uniref:Inorganic triphosphatase YgiF n=1 Tax=Ottowia thiooxydans TaxID=219182 RepID=A0ABV2QD39_9BURK